MVDFKYCFNSTVSDSTQACGVTSVVNNGNVTRIFNNRESARSQRFTYDELNRINTARTDAIDATGRSTCWGQVCGYEIWANLLSIDGISPEYDGCVQENLSVGVNEQNQVAGNGYDAAGNMSSALGQTGRNANPERQGASVGTA